ncbi:MAG: alpha-hydroxy-acid oxidizing protein [Nitrospinae bacterium]|nr:alpha-hydroxy-acid oxidizing protein [Nitrospinota bacterium]
MTEAAYQEIYERAQENLEKSGAGNPYDILGPDLPGTETALMGYERFGLRMRLMLTDSADTEFDFLGKKLKTPIMTGSMSANTLAAHWAEEGAARFGTQYWIGDCTDDTWREAAATYPSSIRIVKPWRDRQRTLTSLKLAEDTGAFAVGMDFESGFYNPECEPQRADALEGYIKATGLPFVFKAVGSADTARIARDAGAAAIIVTTHGGAHGPSWGHPMEILPEVVDAVGDDVLVLAESGVRRGDDVLKLLAQGARGVTSGRALVLGLFAGGPAGVVEILELLQAELKKSMVLAGCKDLASISGDILIER